MAAPYHNNGGKKDKLWRDALMVAIKRTDSEGRVMLAKIAQKVVEAAVEGDMSAIKEIGDRIDGKAPQSLDVKTTRELSISELTDADLAAIIAGRGGSEGAVEAPKGKNKPH